MQGVVYIRVHSWHCRAALHHQGVAASVQMRVCPCEPDILGGVWVTAVPDVYSSQITRSLDRVCSLNVPHLCCLHCLPSLCSPQPPQPKTPEVLWSESDSAVVHLTDESFDGFLEEHPAVLVMFYAPCE